MPTMMTTIVAILYTSSNCARSDICAIPEAFFRSGLRLSSGTPAGRGPSAAPITLIGSGRLRQRVSQGIQAELVDRLREDVVAAGRRGGMLLFARGDRPNDHPQAVHLDH